MIDNPPNPWGEFVGTVIIHGGDCDFSRATPRSPVLIEGCLGVSMADTSGPPGDSVRFGACKGLGEVYGKFMG